MSQFPRNSIPVIEQAGIRGGIDTQPLEVAQLSLPQVDNSAAIELDQAITAIGNFANAIGDLGNFAQRQQYLDEREARGAAARQAMTDSATLQAAYDAGDATLIGDLDSLDAGGFADKVAGRNLSSVRTAAQEPYFNAMRETATRMWIHRRGEVAGQRAAELAQNEVGFLLTAPEADLGTLTEATSRIRMRSGDATFDEIRFKNTVLKSALDESAKNGNMPRWTALAKMLDSHDDQLLISETRRTILDRQRGELKVLVDRPDVPAELKLEQIDAMPALDPGIAATAKGAIVTSAITDAMKAGRPFEVEHYGAMLPETPETRNWLEAAKLDAEKTEVRNTFDQISNDPDVVIQFADKFVGEGRLSPEDADRMIDRSLLRHRDTATDQLIAQIRSGDFPIDAVPKVLETANAAYVANPRDKRGLPPDQVDKVTRAITDHRADRDALERYSSAVNGTGYIVSNTDAAIKKGLEAEGIVDANNRIAQPTDFVGRTLATQQLHPDHAAAIGRMLTSADPEQQLNAIGLIAALSGPDRAHMLAGVRGAFDSVRERDPVTAEAIAVVQDRARAGMLRDEAGIKAASLAVQEALKNAAIEDPRTGDALSRVRADLVTLGSRATLADGTRVGPAAGDPPAKALDPLITKTYEQLPGAYANIVYGMTNRETADFPAVDAMPAPVRSTIEEAFARYFADAHTPPTPQNLSRAAAAASAAVFNRYDVVDVGEGAAFVPIPPTGFPPAMRWNPQTSREELVADLAEHGIAGTPVEAIPFSANGRAGWKIAVNRNGRIEIATDPETGADFNWTPRTPVFKERSLEEIELDALQRFSEYRSFWDGVADLKDDFDRINPFNYLSVPEPRR